LGSLPPKKIFGGPKTSKFQTWRFDREYLRMGTRYRRRKNGVGNCNHSHTCLPNLVIFGPQTSKNQTGISTHSIDFLTLSYLDLRSFACPYFTIGRGWPMFANAHLIGMGLPPTIFLLCVLAGQASTAQRRIGIHISHWPQIAMVCSRFVENCRRIVDDGGPCSAPNGTRLVDGQPCTIARSNVETLITRWHVVDFPNQCFLELKDRNTVTAMATSNGTERCGEHKNFDDPFQISWDQLKSCWPMLQMTSQTPRLN